MEKNIILKYILDKKENIKTSKVFPRTIPFKFTENFVNVIIGPRRAGKTYFLYDSILNKLKLKDEEFIFMDFEDAALNGINSNDVAETINLHEEYYKKKPRYLFFDEIQGVNNWDKAIRTLFETKKYVIFLSGSSSKLLSKEIATSLRGRAISHSVLPLSFKEFLNFRKVELKNFYSSSEENKIKNYLREYLKYGGFPNIVIEKEIAERFFQEYVDLVVFRDVIERHKIKNVFIIKFLIKSMISSFAKEFSIHNLFNTLKSQNIKVSKKTLYEYALYLEDAFFSFLLKKFSYSMKKTDLSIPKIFINDMGLVNFSSMNFSENLGKIMENAVFLELLRREKEIFYFKAITKEEADFVIKEGKKIKQIFQVCYSLSEPEVKKREINSLIKAGKELKCNNLSIITWDYEAEEKIRNKKIKFIPIWKWLLQEKIS